MCKEDLVCIDFFYICDKFLILSSYTLVNYISITFMGLKDIVYLVNDYYNLLLCCRHALASLHFNENIHRDKQRTVDGEVYYNVQYPKFKFGDEIVREVAVPPTYGMLCFQILTM